MRNNKDENTPALSDPKMSIRSIRVQRHSIEHIYQYIGPIPSPELFRKYGEVVPDAPERILRVFEQDSQHRREMQKLSITFKTRRDTRAQWMAFVIMVVALGVTAVSVIFGQNVAPGIITGLATLFLALKVLFIGEKKESEDLDTEEE